jgi:hypothetical protein
MRKLYRDQLAGHVNGQREQEALICAAGHVSDPAWVTADDPPADSQERVFPARSMSSACWTRRSRVSSCLASATQRAYSLR